LGQRRLQGILQGVGRRAVALDLDRHDPVVGRGAPATRALGRSAASAWTSFARTGDPNAARSGLPAWPRYEPTRRATMIFNTRSRIEYDPFAEFRGLMPLRGA